MSLIELAVLLFFFLFVFVGVLVLEFGADAINVIKRLAKKEK
jgi:hypothetical protein